MTIGTVSIGILPLALWLILTGLSSVCAFPPSQVMGVLALVAGILLLVGRRRRADRRFSTL